MPLKSTIMENPSYVSILSIVSAIHLRFAVLCEAPSAQDRADGVMCHQIVMEFDMATWRVSHLYFVLVVCQCTSQQRAIEVFQITESMIPQRPPAKTKLGDKWYG